MTARKEYLLDSEPEITFNKNTDKDNWYRLISIIFDTNVRNIEDEKIDMGIEDYDSKLGKGTGRLKVGVFAASEGKLNKLIADLKEALNPILMQENPNSDEGYLPFKWTETIDTTAYNMEVWVKSLEIPRVLLNENGSGAITECNIKAKEPKKFSQETIDIIVHTASATGTGTNAGDMPTYPTITITGPSQASPKIYYSETGEYFEVNDTLGLGDEYIIDCKEATVKKNGVNAYDKKTAGSKFLSLKSGVITIVCSNLSSGHAHVAFKSAWTL